MAHRSSHFPRPHCSGSHHRPDYRLLQWKPPPAADRMDRRIQGNAGFDNSTQAHRSNHLLRSPPCLSVQFHQSPEERDFISTEECRNIVQSGCGLIHHIALHWQHAPGTGNQTYKYRIHRTHRPRNHMHRGTHIQKCRTGQRRKQSHNLI